MSFRRGMSGQYEGGRGYCAWRLRTSSPASSTGSAPIGAISISWVWRPACTRKDSSGAPSEVEAGRPATTRNLFVNDGEIVVLALVVPDLRPRLKRRPVRCSAVATLHRKLGRSRAQPGQH